MLAKASRKGDGHVYPVERRCALTPQEFRERYFVPWYSGGARRGGGGVAGYQEMDPMCVVNELCREPLSSADLERLATLLT